MDVDTAIDQMATEVKRGEFTTAATIGNTAPYPLAIPKSLITIKNTIYEGGQAIVYEASLDTTAILPGSTAATIVSNNDKQQQEQPTTTANRHSNNNDKNPLLLPVAVKRAIVREHADLERFREEIRLLAKLAPHPGIVSLIGARLLPPDYTMILGLEASNAAKELYEMRWRPGWGGALRLGAQLAEALAHMHSLGVIHRDIKPANILLGLNNQSPKFTDLGIAARLDTGCDYLSNSYLTPGCMKPTGGFHKQHLVGTLEYMAPEILVKKPHSKAADVFALAITINELAGAQFPYSDCTRDNPLAHTILEMGYGRQELATAVAAEGLRPTVAPHAPSGVGVLLRACWIGVPQQRPSAAELAVALHQLAALCPDVPEADGGRVDGSNTVLNSTTATNKKQQQPPSSSPLGRSKSLFGGPLTSTTNPPWSLPLIQQQQNLINANIRAAAGSFATAGLRGEDKMEDRCVVIRNFNDIPGCMVFGVFDGHRGPEAADYLASTIEMHILQRWEASTSAEDVLKTALLDADVAFRAQAAAVADHNMLSNVNAGSTATIALLLGNSLSVANLGDSRAVLCRTNTSTTTAITVDQTADREDERARIVGSSGVVSVRMGNWRVGEAGMQVTRSVGDDDLKGQGVVAEAETYTVNVFGNDSGGNGSNNEDGEYIIVGTDGLWDKLSGEDALELIYDTVKQPAMCAQRLVMESLARGSKDNVTSIVVVLNPNSIGTAEKIYHQGRAKYSTASAAKRIVARLVEDEMHDTY